MRVDLLYNSNRLRCAVPCDTMVHPDYRRQGVFAMMNELALDIEKEKRTVLMFNFPNKISGAGYLKQGWREVKLLEDYIRPLRPSKVGRGITRNAVLGSILGVGYSALFGWRSTGARSGTRAVDIEIYREWPKILEQLDASYDARRLELERSEQFMRWRLDSNPLERNLYVVASHGSTLLGFVALAISTRTGGLVQGLVVDDVMCCKDPAPSNELVRAVMELAVQHGCDYLRAWPSERGCLTRDVLSRHGFVTVAPSLNKKVSAVRLPRLVTKEIDSSLLCGANPQAADEWYLSPVFRDPT
jgi:GNAT superfamily N-acetyltransferase